MNCKPGDLAIVVRSAAGNEGRLVEVLKLLRYGVPDTDHDGEPCWKVRALDRKPIKWTGRYGGDFLPDARLRPIRDTDAPDEMTLIAPLHKEAQCN